MHVHPTMGPLYKGTWDIKLGIKLEFLISHIRPLFTHVLYTYVNPQIHKQSK